MLFWVALGAHCVVAGGAEGAVGKDVDVEDIHSHSSLRKNEPAWTFGIELRNSLALGIVKEFSLAKSRTEFEK